MPLPWVGYRMSCLVRQWPPPWIWKGASRLRVQGRGPKFMTASRASSTHRKSRPMCPRPHDLCRWCHIRVGCSSTCATGPLRRSEALPKPLAGEHDPRPRGGAPSWHPSLGRNIPRRLRAGEKAGDCGCREVSCLRTFPPSERTSSRAWWKIFWKCSSSREASLGALGRPCPQPIWVG